MRAGSINPNVFQDQCDKYGSFGNPDPKIRQAALDHVLASAAIASGLGSRDLSLWFADGSNYPGTQNIRRRQCWRNAKRQAPAGDTAGDTDSRSRFSLIT